MADYCCNNMLDVVDADVHRHSQRQRAAPHSHPPGALLSSRRRPRRHKGRIPRSSSSLSCQLGHQLLPAPPWTPQQPQVYRVDNRGLITDGHVGNAQRAHALSSFWNARMVDTGIVISLPRFAPAAARLWHVDVVPPAKQAASKGTYWGLPAARPGVPRHNLGG